MDNIRLTNGMYAEVGCLIDNHHGQYMIDRMAEIADMLINDSTTYAEQVKDLRKLIDTGYPDNVADAWDKLHDLWDHIEGRLNDLLPDDSEHLFGPMPDTSDWGLYPIDDEDGE